MSRPSTELVVGFIPLLDCAALTVAKELGFAADEGIELTLVKESSWASIRDRLIVGHFDAAHMLGPMAVSTTLGIGHVAVPIIAPFALGLGGNAVTFSIALRDELQRHGGPTGPAPRTAEAWTSHAMAEGEALRRVVAARARTGHEPLTLGMVYPFSCHNYELRYWLAAVGIDPDRDVRLVVIPPPLLVESMRAGYIDGFCVGEPWNSVAVEADVGVIAFPTTAVWRLSPEKVLGCRSDWADRHEEELAALLRALYRASEWCERSENHGELAQLLADPHYIGAPRDLLHRALTGVVALGHHSPAVPLDDFHVSVRQAATFPWVSHALWFYSQMVRWGQTHWSEAGLVAARATYRPDLYRAALAPLDLDLPTLDMKVEGDSAAPVAVPSSKGTLTLGPWGFVDGRTFDPSDLPAYLRALARPRGA
jgi:ABC-type nitrate/sulfonate/bicarbonate transport system substrate-binding protein